MNTQHPLVAAWCRVNDSPGVGCIVPNAAGARLYRKAGWRGLLAEVSHWASEQGLEPASLQVRSALPRPGEPDASAHEPMLLQLEAKSAREWLCHLHVPFDLAVFRGHFPTVPIVPGAQLAGWAALLARRHAGWLHGVRAAQPLKFRRIVQPGLDIGLALDLDASGGRLGYRYESNGHLHAQGVLLAP